MADCGEVSQTSGSSSDTISPTSPPPKHSKKSRAPRKHHNKVKKHRSKRGKRKEKRKYKTSSSSASSSSSVDSSDSDSSECDTPRRAKTALKKSSKLSLSKTQGKEDKPSALFGIFQKHYSSLEAMISTCVNTTASKLYSKKLISEKVQDEVITGRDPDGIKASKVLLNVQKIMKVNPMKLKMLVDVLKEEPSFEDLTKQIIGKC